MITLRGSLRLYCCDEARYCSMVRHYVITLRGSLRLYVFVREVLRDYTARKSEIIVL